LSELPNLAQACRLHWRRRRSLGALCTYARAKVLDGPAGFFHPSIGDLQLAGEGRGELSAKLQLLFRHHGVQDPHPYLFAPADSDLQARRLLWV